MKRLGAWNYVVFTLLLVWALWFFSQVFSDEITLHGATALAGVVTFLIVVIKFIEED